MMPSQNIAVNAWQPNLMATRFLPNFDKGGRTTDLSHHFQHHSHISQGFGANLIQFVIPNFATLPKDGCMTLQWSDYAIKTFQDASDYIASNFYPEYADAFDADVLATAELLIDNAMLGVKKGTLPYMLDCICLTLARRMW